MQVVVGERESFASNVTEGEEDYLGSVKGIKQKKKGGRKNWEGMPRKEVWFCLPFAESG